MKWIAASLTLLMLLAISSGCIHHRADYHPDPYSYR